MKFFTFLFAFCLAFNLTQAQTDSLIYRSYNLSKITDSINLKAKGYYLLKINDLRINKKNLGSLKVRSLKQTVTTEDSLQVYFQHVFYPRSPLDSNLKPIIINIEKLRTFASTNGNIDQAELYIKLNVQTIQNNNLQIIHDFERTFNYQKISRPEFLKSFIFNSLSISLATMPAFIKTIRNKPLNTPKSITTTTPQNIYIIPYPASLKFSNPEFYIAKVKDHRLNKSNEGNVYQGYFNRNAIAKLDSGLEKYLLTALSTDSQINKKPATMHVYDFKCQENLSNMNENAVFSLRANITIDSLEKQYIIHKSIVKTDTFLDADITKFWPQIISQGFNKFLINFPSEKTRIPLDTTKHSLSEEIVIKKTLKRNYYYQDDEIKKLSEFNYIFSKSKDDSLKLIYNRGKILTRTGRSFMGIGAVMFVIPLLDFMRYENPSLKNWYNDEKANINGFGKKTLVQGSIAIFASGLLLKWIGKSLITKAVSRHNKAAFERLSFNIHSGLNNSGYTFNLGIMLGQAK